MKFNKLDTFYITFDIDKKHKQPILNLIEETNREKVIEFSVYLAWETAAYFGRASNPVDEREQQEFFNIFRWLNVDPDQYYEGNKRDIYLKKINLLD